MELIPENISDKRILLAALDWGMGHTTRCVALIRQLWKQNNTLVFAGNKTQREFIEREFPGLQTVALDGYNITLNSDRSIYWQLFTQLGKILKAKKNEYKIAQQLVRELKTEVIISDNRYGFFSESTQNILVTHQLNLQIPRFKNAVNRRLKNWMEKFDCVWVPDCKEQKLTGDLTDSKLSIPVVFIGYLSRFQKLELPVYQYDFLGIVSGPQPERTRFAIMLNDYLKKQNKHVALVGFVGNDKEVQYIPEPTTAQLEILINASCTVISRAGYTTIMEMMVLEKNAILIPTPGQFEQEYLAGSIRAKNLTFVEESEFFGIKVKVYR